MEQFEEPTIEIISLEEDVITTSGCGAGGENETEQDIL